MKCASCRLLTESLAIERQRVDLLLGQLTSPTKPPVAPVEMPEPDVPPDVVMQAMRAISPTDDETFKANYRYWEANKELAAKHPKDFADQIMSGA